MPLKSGLKCLLCLATVSGVSVITIADPSPAVAQPSRCDSIEDRRRRQNCRAGESDARRYEEEARGWREEEAQIRRRHEEACRRVGMVARFVGQGRTFRAACEAPRRVYDSRR